MRDTWERRRFLRTHGVNAARGISENRSILPANITFYLRTSHFAHAE
jgi:hypothetical protein